MITEANFNDLDTKGYTVVPGVVTPRECDAAVREYQQWLRQFGDSFPKSFNSIINQYNTGHMEVTWRLRLQTQPVFAQLWKTDKLLTSFDAIAIGRPPEDGKETFQEPDRYWLHSDQTSERYGLHAYQGALYLEEQCKDDWTFQVMEGSHKLLDAFYHQDGKEARKTNKAEYFKLTREEIQTFKDGGCHLTRVPVPKGGMVLWDSRLIHANARPLPNRKHSGRWRYVVFVCMTPARWAGEQDMADRSRAYGRAMMTTHWPSQHIKSFESVCPARAHCPDRVPRIARTEEVKKLSGAIPYDFSDGQPNGPDFLPEWRNQGDKDT